ncbi:MAG: hypothetical protein LBK95_07515 [Bifidobacteriaceae bacterium]|nr:hypothetical protein [Bifidobacteriaceae bacterium]
MRITAAVGQLAPGEDARANWSVAVRLLEQAADAGARLAVLPEQTMLAQRAGDPARFASLVREAWAWWPDALSDAARRLGLFVVAGGFAASDRPGAGGSASGIGAGLSGVLAEGAEGPREHDPRPWNVLLAVDAGGGVVACQPKTRLYDAFAYRESDMVRAGPRLVSGSGSQVVDLAGIAFGLVNCYELRFPELARGMVAAGAQALALGAAWVRGPLKEDQWVTLARARAIENCAYVLAAGTRAKDTIGRSMIIDSGGVVVAGLADEPEGLAVAVIDTDRVAEARTRSRSLP